MSAIHPAEAGHGYSSVPLVLISGVGRSGTTALRESLGLHPDVHSTERENNIIYDLLDVAHRNCTAQSRRYAMRVSDADYDAAFSRLVLSLLWPTPREPAPSRLLAFSDLTPDRAGYLVRLFPGVRIVYVVRNGIEVVASRMRYDGFKHQPFDAHAGVWSRAMQMAQWGEQRDDFLLVRHENLIADTGPEDETARICRFLALPYAEACARNLREKEYHPTPERKAAAPALLARRSQRWRDWSPDELDVFDATCSEAMDYFGYERPWRPGSLVRAA
jgi:hypothetical protein